MPKSAIFWFQMYTLVMLYRAPKLPDFYRVARFGPGYPQKLLNLALLKIFWQKSGNASFCDLATKTNKISTVYNLGYL